MTPEIGLRRLFKTVFLLAAIAVPGTAQAQSDIEQSLAIGAIQSRFTTQAPTSHLHLKNIGRIVWSNQPIPLNAQDKVPIKTKFKSSEPIYGRVYLPNSVANTPIFNPDHARPKTNQPLGYEFRLLVNGSVLANRSSIFLRGQLRGTAGMQWTTWQFSPYPKGASGGIGRTGTTWLQSIGTLPPGNHQIRFDFWGLAGKYRTSSPISSGEFTLVIGNGGQTAATSRLPKDAYSGKNLAAIKNRIRHALLGIVTNKSSDIVRVSVTGDWQIGIYRDTKKRFRTIGGSVLLRYSGTKKICRIASYNFISQQKTGNIWAPLEFRSYCLNCAAGQMKCSQ